MTPEDRAAVSATDNAMPPRYSYYQLALPPSQTPVNFLTSPANAQRDAVKAAILNAPVAGPDPGHAPGVGRRDRAVEQRS